MEIIIPTKKNWFIILFLGFWLCGWFTGESFAIRELIQMAGGNFPNLFLFIWLGGWTVGGFFAIRTFLWTVAGREIIEVGMGQLTISRKGVPFAKSKVYNLNESKKFRVQDDNNGFQSMWGNSKRSNFFNIADSGTIRFDYGMQTVKFGNGLDEAEADFVLKKLSDKKNTY